MDYQNLPKNSSLINKISKARTLLVIALVFVMGFIIGNYLDNGNRVSNQSPVLVSDPLSLVKCGGYDAEVHYWDFSSTSKDISELKESGNKQNNFYILCNPAGSGAVMDVYVFKNNKLIFKKEGIYKGKIFFDEGNVLNIFKGAPKDGDANCCPSAYDLERFKYDSGEDTLKLAETKNYTSDQYTDLDTQ